MNEHLPQHEQVFLEREPTSQEIADVLLEIGIRNLDIKLAIHDRKLVRI